MEKEKVWGVVSIVASLIVLFSAMWDARISTFVAFAALLGLGVWQIISQRKEEHSDILKNVGISKDKPDLIEKQAKEKAEHMQKILNFLAGKEKITNNEVENLLGVSNATAERYLNEFEKEGVLKQVGKTGHYTYYKKA